MITYTVPTCPPGARCVQFPATKFYIVSRQLTCSPAGGNYADADAACLALSDVVTKLGKKNWVCGCPTQATGTSQRRPSATTTASGGRSLSMAAPSATFQESGLTSRCCCQAPTDKGSPEAWCAVNRMGLTCRRPPARLP